MAERRRVPLGALATLGILACCAMIALVTIRSVGTSTVLTSSEIHEKEALAAGARELAALELAEGAFERKVQMPTIPAAVSAPPTGNRPAAVAAPTPGEHHAKEQITKLKLKGEKSSSVGKNWRQKERERRDRERKEEWTGPASSEKQRREIQLVRQGEKIEREREERERQVEARVMRRMTHRRVRLDDDADDDDAEDGEAAAAEAAAEESADDKPCPAHCGCEKHAAPCPCCKPKDVAIMLEMPMTCADFSLEAQNKFKCAIAECAWERVSLLTRRATQASGLCGEGSENGACEGEVCEKVSIPSIDCAPEPAAKEEGCSCCGEDSNKEEAKSAVPFRRLLWTADSIGPLQSSGPACLRKKFCCNTPKRPKRLGRVSHTSEEVADMAEEAKALGYKLEPTVSVKTRLEEKARELGFHLVPRSAHFKTGKRQNLATKPIVAGNLEMAKGFMKQSLKMTDVSDKEEKIDKNVLDKLNKLDNDVTATLKQHQPNNGRAWKELDEAAKTLHLGDHHRRRLLQAGGYRLEQLAAPSSDGTQVSAAVQVPAGKAAAVAADLSDPDKINAALSAAGLPEAQILMAPKVMDAAPPVSTKWPHHDAQLWKERVQSTKPDDFFRSKATEKMEKFGVKVHGSEPNLFRAVPLPIFDETQWDHYLSNKGRDIEKNVEETEASDVGLATLKKAGVSVDSVPIGGSSDHRLVPAANEIHTMFGMQSPMPYFSEVNDNSNDQSHIPLRKAGVFIGDM